MSTIDIAAHGALVLAGILSCGLIAAGFKKRHQYPWTWNGQAVFPVLLGAFFLVLVVGTLVAWQVP